MQWRPLMATLFVVIGLGANGWLLVQEMEQGVAPSEARVKKTSKRVDPLIELQYTPGRRSENLRAYGLDDSMVEEVETKLRRMEAEKERLMSVIDASDQQIELHDALCGQTNQIRPRYGALRFLVEDTGGVRRPKRLRRLSSLMVEDWSLVSPIGGVFTEVELAEERQDDATMMAIAAILVGKEQDLLNHMAPWGRGLGNTWSWKRVEKAHPGIRDVLVDYFALMHLVLEVVFVEGGLCGD